MRVACQGAHEWLPDTTGASTGEQRHVSPWQQAMVRAPPSAEGREGHRVSCSVPIRRATSISPDRHGQEGSRMGWGWVSGVPTGQVGIPDCCVCRDPVGLGRSPAAPRRQALPAIQHLVSECCTVCLGLWPATPPWAQLGLAGMRARTHGFRRQPKNRRFWSSGNAKYGPHSSERGGISHPPISRSLPPTHAKSGAGEREDWVSGEVGDVCGVQGCGW